MRGGRNNLLAGSLVVVSIAMAIAVVILLGGFLEVVGKHDYRVRFTITDGVTGLEQGSRVMLGGRTVGVVKGLRFDINDKGYAESLEVAISIDRRIRLREGAVALLISPLLGGSGQINFRTPGEASKRELTKDDIIDGRIAPPTLLADAGYGGEQKAQVQNIIKNVSNASDKIDKLMDDAQALVADARAKWPNWSDRADSIMKNVDETAARGPALTKSAEERLEQFRKAVETVQAYMDENRTDIRQSIVNAREILEKGNKFADRLNGQLAEKTAQFLDDAKAAFAEAREAVNKIELLSDEQLPNIRRMMANFRLASDQLAATLAEVRRSPWRLLYRPDKREQDFELLYDSARSYAAAVSDLRAASETIQSLSAGGVSAPDRMQKLITDLDAAFERYKQTEVEFLRQLNVQGTAVPEAK